MDTTELDIPADNWVAKLALETAMGYHTPEELFLRCGQPREIYEMVRSADDFNLAVAAYRKELHQGPSPLRMKAKRMLWETIGNLRDIANDSEISAADRIAAIREVAKLAGEAAEAPAAVATATIQIVRFSDGDSRVVN